MNKKYRRCIIAGNWKMNRTPSQVRGFVEELRGAMPASLRGCSVVLCVPATHLHALSSLRSRRIAVGAQNVSEFESGAHTGEISAEMLRDLDVRYCIVGHSERRQDNHETDKMVSAKVCALLDKGITPIICVGETLEQRERELTLEHIAYQVKAALSGLNAEQVRRCVIAYEPVWAIGTGRTATAGQAEEVCYSIREMLRTRYGALISRKVSILYGGSMNGDNCAELLAQPDIDGGLIGGASLRSGEFAKIVAAGCAE